MEITAERLQRIADKYNKSRAKPLNANDYAPILIDHNRAVDMLKGRVIADLTVEDCEDPDTGTMGKGLFGTLRVDDPEAVKKVESGQYAQVSLSFDEEDDTLWEVSFVAVEAARRSQALEQGDPDMSVELAAQLKAANDSNQALKAKVRQSLTVRKALMLSAGENATAAVTAIEKAISELSAGMKASKTAILKSQFKGFIRTGQLAKAEFDKLKFESLSEMSSDAIAVLLESYSGRPISPHVRQFGQSGAQPIAGATKMTAAQTRAAMKAQKAGKMKVDEPTGDDGQGDHGNEPQETPGPKDAAGGEDKDMDDYKEALRKMGEVEPVVKECRDFMKKMSESLKKMSEEHDKEEKDA